MNISGQVASDYTVELSGSTVNASGADLIVFADSDFITENGLDTHLDGLRDAFADRIADLQAQIAEAETPMEEMRLSDEVMRLEKLVGDLQSDLQNVASDLIASGQFSMEDLRDNPETIFEAAVDGVRGLISGYRAEIAESYANYGMEALSNEGSAIAASDAIDDEVAAELAGVDGDAITAGAEFGDGPDQAAVGGVSPEELVSLLSSDPDAFMEEMRGLDPEKREATMMMVQQQLQQINQLFSMMSQFSQAMHDTQKAVIQNLRV